MVPGMKIVKGTISKLIKHYKANELSPEQLQMDLKKRLGDPDHLVGLNASMEENRWLIGKNQSLQFSLSGTAHSEHGNCTLSRF